MGTPADRVTDNIWGGAGIDTAADDALNRLGGNETPPAVETPVETPPAETPVETPPAETPAETPAVEAAPSEPVIPESVKPIVDAVEQIGGLDELQLRQEIAEPLVGSAEINTEGLLDVLEARRGPTAVDTLANDMLGLYANYYAEQLLANPDLIVTDPLHTPEGQRQLAAANRIKAFNAWQANGGQAVAPVVTAPVTTTAVIPTVKKPDLSEYTIDSELKTYIDSLEATATAATTANTALDARLKALEGFRDTSTKTAEERQREEQARVERERVTELASTIVTPARNLISQVKFSTNPDAAQAAREDDEIRQELYILTENQMDAGRDQITVRGQPMTVLEASNQARTLYAKGDKIGARQIVAALRVQCEQIARSYVTKRQGRLQAALASDNGVHASNQTGQRTQVSGPGSGSTAATPVIPPPKKGEDFWSGASTDADVDRLLASRGRSPVA